LPVRSDGDVEPLQAKRSFDGDPDPQIVVDDEDPG
jgi:hypothetical protein